MMHYISLQFEAIVYEELLNTPSAVWCSVVK